MTSQTILQYNGVRLQNVQTLSFVETPINSDSGQYLYTKTELKVLGYVTTTQFSDATPKPTKIGAFPTFETEAGQGASQQFKLLKLYLAQPRRRLIYSVTATGTPNAGDADFVTPIFTVDPAKEDILDGDDLPINMLVSNDVKAGPIPGPVSVTHLSNNTVWRVEFTVTFHTIPPCIPVVEIGAEVPPEGDSLWPTETLDDQIALETIPTTLSGTQRQLGVLSNRWSCRDLINENGYTSRTYTGSVMLANPNWNPNDFRAITIPPVVPGMQRKSIEYVASEDNLSLRYVVNDAEATITAPSPARTIHITHNETFIGFGATGNFALRVQLTGERHTPLYELMVLAYAIIEQRLRLKLAVIVNDTSSILLQETSVTTEQGSDQSHSLNMFITGTRHSMDNIDGGGQQPGTHLRKLMTRSVTWRPVNDNTITPGSLLDGYNNVLSKGNRDYEQPDSEGGIPAISCLHAKLTSPCSEKFDFETNTPGCDEVSNRISRQNAIEGSTTAYSNAYLWGCYDTSIDIQISDNLADAPTNIKFTDAHQSHLYNQYNISSTYTDKSLKVALPVAQTSGTPVVSSVVTSIGPPQYTRRVRIEAERVGRPPRLPEPVASFSERHYGGTVAETSEYVTNTLMNSVVTHLNPSPVADGLSLIYTTYLEMEYSQNKRPAEFRYGFPDYIKPTTYGSGVPATDRASGTPVTEKALYRNDLMDVFASETSLSSW